jgi:hypothetical protein
MLLAQKIWDDTPIGNIDFPAIWQNAYPEEEIDVAVVNSMEKLFLILLSYDVHVTRCVGFCSTKTAQICALITIFLRFRLLRSTTYTQFYFELRDLTDAEFSLEPLSEQAVCSDV